QAVFQFEGGYRKTVDEESKIERALGFGAAVAELAGDAEDVRGMAFRSGFVSGRGCSVEQVDGGGAVLQAVAEQIDHAPAVHLSLKPMEKFRPRRSLSFDAEFRPGVRLGI